MDRRRFLVGAGALGGAALSGGLLSACRPAEGSVLNLPAAQCPIDHVVVLMMENRSFDHWLGWMGEDEAWLEAGRGRYGAGFTVDAAPHQTYLGPDGTAVSTAPMAELLASGNPWRGCDHPDPGHSWRAGRVQRDAGFLATGSGNDAFALGYYRGQDLPFTSALARRFTVCDAYFSSILGPTYPNREYLHAGQSGGIKTNYLPTAEGGFSWPTIWDRLAAAGVSAGYYYVDLPVTALFGQRHLPISHKIDDYFADCAAGTLPQVTFLDPGFLGGSRTDNHPHADIRAGEAFMRDVFAAFARSPHWGNGLFVLTYDEWGGFFDHVAPPVVVDDRLNLDDDQENFGQTGFRVPTVLASPYSRVGSVDHERYDHASVLRFLEWRFLGAPAIGVAQTGSQPWWLTARDRWAMNLGASLVVDAVPGVGFDLDVPVAPPSPECGTAGAVAGGLAGADGAATTRAGTPIGYQKHSFEDAYDQGYFARLGYDTEPSAMAAQWTDV